MYNVGIDNPSYKHGEKSTKLYMVWEQIKKRCLNHKSKDFKNYGGRGITICNEWLEFIPFRDWSLSNGYSEGLQINRINNNGNYEPNNCNFITQTENLRNTRHCKLTLEIANEIRYLHKMKLYTRKNLSIRYNVSKSTIDKIITDELWRNK